MGTRSLHVGCGKVQGRLRRGRESCPRSWAADDAIVSLEHVFFLDCRPDVRDHRFVRIEAPWSPSRGGRIVRLLLLSLPFLLSPLAGHAEDSLSAAQKKYQKEMKALLASLEIADSALPSAVVNEGEAIVPSFKLSNKTNHELLVPLALGFPSGRGGVLGFPVWSFVGVDKKSRAPLMRKGALAYAFKIDPQGSVLIDASKVDGMTTTAMGLVPGAYQMTVTFHPFVGGAGPSMTSKPFKFVVKQSDKPVAVAGRADSAKQAGPAVALGGSRLGPDPVRISAPAVLPFIRLGRLEFASESVQVGTPLGCSFDLLVDSSNPLPPEQHGMPGPRLNCSWTILKLSSQKSPKTKTRIAGSIMPVSDQSMGRLRNDGTLTLKLTNETVGLPPGFYELAVTLWQEGAQGRRTNGDSKVAPFRIIR